MDDFVVGQRPRTFREMIASQCYFNSIRTHVLVPLTVGSEYVEANTYNISNGEFDCKEDFPFPYFTVRDYSIVSEEDLRHLSPNSDLVWRISEGNRVVRIDHSPLYEIRL